MIRHFYFCIYEKLYLIGVAFVKLLFPVDEQSFDSNSRLGSEDKGFVIFGCFFLGDPLVDFVEISFLSGMEIFLSIVFEDDGGGAALQSTYSM